MGDASWRTIWMEFRSVTHHTMYLDRRGNDSAFCVVRLEGKWLRR